MDYKLIRSRRRHRSASLNVNRAGEIVVRAPLYMPKFLVDRFVAKSERWIKRRLFELSKPSASPVTHFTRQSLEAFIHRQINKYSSLLKVKPARIRLTDASTYWGSCSPRNLLSFSSRLRFTPPPAVAYVVVHELCHLRHRGHGKRFWALVKKTYPRSDEMKKILRQISLSH